MRGFMCRVRSRAPAPSWSIASPTPCPSPDTLVVVSCAGRTRGIIGAQSLINAGVPNRVMSLAGGTQGWRLAGLELESGLGDGLRPVSPDAAAAAQQRAAGCRNPFRRAPYRPRDARRLARRGRDGARPTSSTCAPPRNSPPATCRARYSAPGGQLVQAIDRWVGTRGARLVLVDDTGARARS